MEQYFQELQAKYKYLHETKTNIPTNLYNQIKAQEQEIAFIDEENRFLLQQSKVKDHEVQKLKSTIEQEK